MIFKTCDICGAHLDAGEVCDCALDEKGSGTENKAKEKHPEATGHFSLT